MLNLRAALINWSKSHNKIHAYSWSAIWANLRVGRTHVNSHAAPHVSCPPHCPMHTPKKQFRNRDEMDLTWIINNKETFISLKHIRLLKKQNEPLVYSVVRNSSQLEFGPEVKRSFSTEAQSHKHNTDIKNPITGHSFGSKLTFSRLQIMLFKQHIELDCKGRLWRDQWSCK